MRNDTKVKAELKKAFKSAKSAGDTLKAFKDMEKLFGESELGVECWTVADKLLREGRASEEVIRFGERALRILIQNQDNNIPCFGINENNSFTHNHGTSLFIPGVLNVLGSACLDLKRYGESLSYLNWADRNLSKLEKEDSSPCNNNCVLQALQDTQHQLLRVKVAMGRREEVVIHLRKILEIKEKTMEEGCIELGEANKKAFVAYIAVVNFEEALPFCLKALEIYTKRLGPDSVEVAQITRHLAVIYNALGEYEKALEKNKLSQGVLKKMAPDSPDLLKAETENATMLIHLGRYKEAIGVLKGVVSRAETGGSEQAIAFVTMAKALCSLGKFTDAKKRMRTAQRILEKKEICPLFVASGFGDMSLMHEMMNDFGKAISLLRRYLSIPELPRKALLEGSTRLFSLFSLSGKEKEGIPYMEDVVENLKQKFGPEHCIVSYGYINLGLAYLKSSQVETASKSFLNAKDIMDVTLGPHHLDSLNTSQTLSATYARLRRYDPAIEIQEKVVECLKGLQGPREQEFLNIAVRLLNDMKERVAGPTFWEVLSLKMAMITLQRFQSLMEIN